MLLLYRDIFSVRYVTSLPRYSFQRDMLLLYRDILFNEICYFFNEIFFSTRYVTSLPRYSFQRDMLLLYAEAVTKSRFKSALFWHMTRCRSPLHRHGSLKSREVTFVQEQCVTDYYCCLLASLHDSSHAQHNGQACPNLSL